MSDFIRKSSGNVYHDLGFADAEAMKMKADIVSRIYKIMEENNISCEFASASTGIPINRISTILDGKFHDVGEYDLLYLLLMLGNDIEIRIKPSKEKYGKIIFA